MIIWQTWKRCRRVFRDSIHPPPQKEEEEENKKKKREKDTIIIICVVQKAKRRWRRIKYSFSDRLSPIVSSADMYKEHASSSSNISAFQPFPYFFLNNNKGPTMWVAPARYSKLDSLALYKKKRKRNEKKTHQNIYPCMWKRDRGGGGVPSLIYMYTAAHSSRWAHLNFRSEG